MNALHEAILKEFRDLVNSNVSAFCLAEEKEHECHRLEHLIEHLHVTDPQEIKEILSGM